MGSPRPSPRRWLQSKVASAKVRKRIEVLIPSAGRILLIRHIALTIALISFRKNPSIWRYTRSKQEATVGGTRLHVAGPSDTKPQGIASQDAEVQIADASCWYRTARLRKTLNKEVLRIPFPI
ncbi:hypothetical protein F4805DRAFT_411440 [Annulohypoxylon moriforme]|nr:hypothetical protein F4805DRAFT_411440 [Annulohypoxylon moriforme]